VNVLTLSSLYPRPYNPVDGIFVHQHVLHLRKQGCAGTVICPIPWAPKILAHSKKWKRYASVPLKAEFDGVVVYYPKYFRPPGMWFRPLAGLSIYLAVRALLLRLDNMTDFDLIHAHTILPDGLAAVRIAGTMDVPCIATSWGTDIHTTPFENSRTLRTTKYVLQTADQVTTVSEGLRSVAAQLTETKGDIRVIYTGVDTNRFRATGSPKEGRQRLQLEPDTPHVLFIGRLTRLKGVFDLVKAFADLTKRYQARLLLVGDGAGRQNVSDCIEQLDLGQQVKFVGRIDHASIPEWLNAADILVLPSHGEGLPNAVLEAMSSERAVVASDVGGIPELITDGVNGLLVPPAEPRALSTAISSLITDPGSCQQMGRRGRETVLERFTWDRHAAEVYATYRDVISRGE
jgi:N-acetyl-alpha-D-glucosaminyl L-malate synthase BshA